jgi:hypothetical protein
MQVDWFVDEFADSTFATSCQILYEAAWMLSEGCAEVEVDLATADGRRAGRRPRHGKLKKYVA